MKIVPALSAALALSITIAGAGPAHARDAVAEGRAHLRKANGLAGNDRCEAAIKEYSLAYDKLHDPVVLFNRAECYRRIGEDASAAADYRAFLAAVPGAPNRTEIEAKIAALDLGPEPNAAPPVARAAPVARSPRSAPPPAPNAVPPRMVPQNVVPPNLAPPPSPAAAVAETPLVAEPVAPAAPVAPPSDEATGSEHHGGLWMWAALGAAVAGGAVGAYLVLRSPGATPPSTELGNYRF